MSQKYGIKQSLLNMAIKYAAPKLEDPTPEHVCSPCERESRKYVEAPSFCKDCNEKLCIPCLSQHRKFQFLKNHKIVKVKEAFGETKPKPTTKLTDTCYTHATKILNQYCTDHDEVGCASCMAANHKDCQEPVYITKVATGLMKSSLPKETRDAIMKTKKDLYMLKLKRMSDKRRVLKEKESIMTTVTSLRKRLDDILDRLENSAKEKLTVKFDSDMKTIKHDIKKCDEAMEEFDEVLKKLRTGQEAEMFIRIKFDAKNSQVKGQKIVNNVTPRVGTENLKFTVDETLEEWLDNLIAFGKFDHDLTVYKGSFYGKYNGGFEKDVEQEDYIFNGCVNLPGGQTILSDWKNKKLKIFDTSYKQRGFLELPAAPYSMTFISQEEILVTLRDEKIVQFVSVDEKCNMAAIKKFKIDEFPRGIGYQNNEIYITCGGGIGEINGQLRVYSLSGVLNRVFQDDKHGQRIFLSPKDIVINLEKTRIHVVDRKRGVITINTDGKVLSVFSDPSLKDPFGLTIDGEGNLFAIGLESNNVMQITGDGVKVAEVLRESDGISSLLAVCCHISVNTRLILTTENSHEFKVFTLGEK